MRRVYVEEMVRRLREQGNGTRAIARKLGIGRQRVRRVLALAALGEAPGAVIRRGSWLDPYRAEFLMFAAAGMNAVSITREMTLMYPEVFTLAAYESVKKYLARERPASAPEVFCRVETAPGEEAQIDFFRLWRGLVPEGQPWLFVGTLSFSRRTFTKVVRDQRVPTFLGCVRAMFEFFGGVVEKVKPDNLKSAILLDQLGRRHYQAEFARFSAHYDFIADPARPGRPTDKGKVERTGRYVKGALRGRQFDGDAALEAWLRTWTVDVADVRLHGTTRRRPIDLFEIERRHLRPLPPEPFETALVREHGVRKDAHIAVARSWYSVPPSLAGETVTVRLTDRVVEVIFETETVARHERAAPGSFVTLPEHRPHRGTSTQGIRQVRLERIRSLGVEAALYLERLREARDRIFADDLRELVRLLDRWGPEPTARAIARAFHFDALGYGVIERILERGLWRLPIEKRREDQPTPVEGLRAAGLARSLEDYIRLV